MVKIVKPRAKIGPKEQAVRELRNHVANVKAADILESWRKNPKPTKLVDLKTTKAPEGTDLTIPPFLKRPPTTQAQDDELQKKHGTIEIKRPVIVHTASVKKNGAQQQESSVMRTSAAKKTTKKAEARKPTPTAKKTTKAAKANARTPVNLRKDGLREGTGMATLVDTVCRKQGATNEELCKAVGWKQCLPMMKKACERAKVKLRVEKKDGEPTRYFGSR